MKTHPYPLVLLYVSVAVIGILALLLPPVPPRRIDVERQTPPIHWAVITIDGQTLILPVPGTNVTITVH
jgi:hypothetical protein